jgi:hypothetical protein
MCRALRNGSGSSQSGRRKRKEECLPDTFLLETVASARATFFRSTCNSRYMTARSDFSACRCAGLDEPLLVSSMCIGPSSALILQAGPPQWETTAPGRAMLESSLGVDRAVEATIRRAVAAPNLTRVLSLIPALRVNSGTGQRKRPAGGGLSSGRRGPDFIGSGFMPMASAIRARL